MPAPDPGDRLADAEPRPASGSSSRQAALRAAATTLAASVLLGALGAMTVALYGGEGSFVRTWALLSLVSLPVAFVFGAVANAVVTGARRSRRAARGER